MHPSRTNYRNHYKILNNTKKFVNLMNSSNSVRRGELSLLIPTIIAFSFAIALSFSALQDYGILPASRSFSLQFAFVFAQSTDEPVLRYSDDVGNPVFNRPGFTAEVAADGLSLPTAMAFLSQNDILVLEKDKGTVMRVIDGELQPQPLLDVSVATEVERCMCGIAISQNNETGKTYVFLYYTEAEGGDGGAPIGNRLYRYELENGQSGGVTGVPTLTPLLRHRRVLLRQPNWLTLYCYWIYLQFLVLDTTVAQSQLDLIITCISQLEIQTK